MAAIHPNQSFQTPDLVLIFRPFVLALTDKGKPCLRCYPKHSANLGSPTAGYESFTTPENPAPKMSYGVNIRIISDMASLGSIFSPMFRRAGSQPEIFWNLPGPSLAVTAPGFPKIFQAVSLAHPFQFLSPTRTDCNARLEKDRRILLNGSTRMQLRSLFPILLM